MLHLLPLILIYLLLHLLLWLVDFLVEHSLLQSHQHAMTIKHAKMPYKVYYLRH